MISHLNVPFFFHIVGEIPASYNFLAHPSSTLPQPQPYAHPVIRQYALLLVSTNLIAGIFLFCDRPTTVSCKVAGALAIYHLGPLMRAVTKIWKGKKLGIDEGVGGAGYT